MGRGADEQDASRALLETWPFIAGLIVAAMVGGVVIMAVRRRMLSRDSGAADGSLMDSLRRMRDRGEMSGEEYESTVRTIAKRAAGIKHGASPGIRGGSAGGPVIRTPDPLTGPAGRAGHGGGSGGLPAVGGQGRSADHGGTPTAEDFPPLVELPPDEGESRE